MERFGLGCVIVRGVDVRGFGLARLPALGTFGVLVAVERGVAAVGLPEEARHGVSFSWGAVSVASHFATIA